MGVIDLKIITQTGFKVLRCTEGATLKKPTGQDAQPPRNLVEPGAMFGCKVEHVLMARIAQAGPPLYTSAQVVGHQGHLAPLGDEAADSEAPVGVEIIHHPVVTMHVWQLLDDMSQMGGEIDTGAGRAQMPHDLTLSVQQTRRATPVCHDG